MINMRHTHTSFLKIKGQFYTNMYEKNVNLIAGIASQLFYISTYFLTEPRYGVTMGLHADRKTERDGVPGIIRSKSHQTIT